MIHIKSGTDKRTIYRYSIIVIVLLFTIQIVSGGNNNIADFKIVRTEFSYDLIRTMLAADTSLTIRPPQNGAAFGHYTIDVDPKLWTPIQGKNIRIKFKIDWIAPPPAGVITTTNDELINNNNKIHTVTAATFKVPTITTPVTATGKLTITFLIPIEQGAMAPIDVEKELDPIDFQLILSPMPEKDICSKCHAIGGTDIPIDKISLMSHYVNLGFILLATVSIIYIWRRYRYMKD